MIIDLLRRNAAAMTWYGSLYRQRIVITPIVWMETMRGARNKLERQELLEFLKAFPLEHSTTDDNGWAMRQFVRFYLSHGVDWPDVMIASVSVRLGVPLYTRNTRHYAALPGVLHAKPY